MMRLSEMNIFCNQYPSIRSPYHVGQSKFVVRRQGIVVQGIDDVCQSLSGRVDPSHSPDQTLGHESLEHVLVGGPVLNVDVLLALIHEDPVVGEVVRDESWAEESARGISALELSHQGIEARGGHASAS